MPPIKPYAKFVFEKLPDAKTRYILREHSGADISGFPARWKQEGHPHKGEGYVTFRETQANCPKMRFAYSLSLERNRMFTSFNLYSNSPNKAKGDFGKDAVLIQLSEDWNSLSIWFFEGLKHYSLNLFDNWISGELELD